MQRQMQWRRQTDVLVEFCEVPQLRRPVLLISYQEATPPSFLQELAVGVTEINGVKFVFFNYFASQGGRS